MIDPVAFYFFGFAVRWYGIAYFSTFIIGIILGKKFCKYTKTIKPDDINIIVNYYIIFAILFGCRLGEFLFYRPNELFSFEIFRIRNGGMSFHGGVIGIILAVIIYSKINKKNAYEVFDLVTMCVPIGLCIGRIANYINQEILGTYCAFGRHYVTLYESFLEGFVLFLILILPIKRNLPIPGITSSLFMIFYGIFRIFCEHFKITEGFINLGFICIPVATFLSTIMIVIGIIFLIRAELQKK